MTTETKPTYKVRALEFTLALIDAPETRGLSSFGLRQVAIKPVAATVADNGRSIVVALTGRTVEPDSTGTHHTTSVTVAINLGYYPAAPEWVRAMVSDVLGKEI